MAEFREVINAMNRMCASFPHTCKGCPLNDIKENTCATTIKHSPEEVEKRIMQWAKEHPVKTNADKFKEVFGVEINHSYSDCIFKYTSVCKDISYCVCEYADFWEQEYKEPGK